MMNNNNPWAGLASYEDPSKSERKLKFCGRDNDIYDVTRLIDDNLLLILYGKSGVGKTSLLNAGVFPKLRLEQYLPVSIRLGTLETNASYQEAIISAIENAMEEAHCSITVYDVVEEQTGNQQPDRLWNYFARHRFANAEQQPLFPVVVLDQFEEVLRNTSLEHVGKAQTLLNQLQYLIDESHALNDCIVDEKEYFYDFNFRFVISIREDELYLLEDNIDDLSLSMFRNCRYRLRSLSEQGAKEAILVPGKDRIADDEKQTIVNRVIELSKRPQSNDIDTLLLSLVCAGTYDKKAGEKITIADFAVWKSNPMEVYYQDAIKSLSADQVRYIQQHLISEDGSRRRVDTKTVKTALGESTYHTLIQGNNRMLVIGEHDQVELLHDQLALAVYEERKNEEEKKRKRKLRQKQVRNAGIIALLVTLAIFIVAYFQFRQLRWKMLENQSRYIAEKIQELDNDNSRLGSLLAIEVLPENLKRPNRPYTLEAEFALRKFTLNNSVSIPIHKDLQISGICFSPDGERCAASISNTVQIYNTIGALVDSIANVVKDKSFNGLDYYIPITDVAFSPDEKHLAFSTYEKIILQNNLSKRFDTIIISAKVGIASISFSPDNNHLAFCTYDGRNGIVNISNHDVHYFSESKDKSSTRRLRYSPNGNLILCVGSNNSVKLWDVSNNNYSVLSVLLDKSDSMVRSSSFSPDGKFIIISSDDKSVKVFDTIGNLLSVLSHPYAVTSAAISNDNKYILSGSYKTLHLWDISSIQNPKEINTITHKKKKWIYNLTIDPKDKFIAYSHGNDDIVIESFEDLFRFDDNWLPCINSFVQKGVKSATFSPDGNYILTSSTTIDTLYYTSPDFEIIPPTYNCQNSITLYDAYTSKIIKTFEKSETQGWIWFDKPIAITPASFSPDGQYIAYAIDTIIKICSTFTDQSITHSNNSVVDYVTFSPNSKQLAFVSADSTVRIIDMTTKDIIWTRKSKHPNDYVTFSHNGTYIAAAGEHNCAIWKKNKAIVHKASPWHPNPSGRISFFSDDLQYLLMNHSLSVAIVENNIKEHHQKNIANYQFHDTITSVTLSPTGNFFIVSSINNTIMMCDPITGNVLCKLKHNNPVISVCFNQCGDKIMTVTSDGTIRIWDFPPLQNLIEQTRERFKDRSLTQEERRMYYLE